MAMTHVEQMRAMERGKIIGGECDTEPRRVNRDTGRLEYWDDHTWQAGTSLMIPPGHAHIIPDPSLPPEPVKKVVRREVTENGAISVPCDRDEWGWASTSEAMCDPRCVAVIFRHPNGHEQTGPAVPIIYICPAWQADDWHWNLAPTGACATPLHPFALEFEVSE